MNQLSNVCSFLYGVESELTRNKLTVCGDLGRGPQSLFLLLLDGIVVCILPTTCGVDRRTDSKCLIHIYVRKNTDTHEFTSEIYKEERVGIRKTAIVKSEQSCAKLQENQSRDRGLGYM